MSKSVNRPALSFARHLGAYLEHLVAAAGGDSTGRWLAEKTDRGKTYFGDIMSGKVAMNTNDIALFARVFGTTPYDFVRDARGWDGDSLSNVTPFPTSPTDDLDYEGRIAEAEIKQRAAEKDEDV
jgi:hypothetical protein